MKFIKYKFSGSKYLWGLGLFLLGLNLDAGKPNIVFIFSDDHATQSISAYGSRINRTPNIDRIATEGALFEANFCTNSICGPSRASILTGKHSHKNGFKINGNRFDPDQLTFPKLLQKVGYHTAVFGKWHLGTNPTGFDKWMVYPGQGSYYKPDYLTPNGKKVIPGYSVEVTTDLALDFLSKQNRDEPFLLMCQYKAPHRNWMPGPKYLTKYDDISIPEPETLFDDYSKRAAVLGMHKMGIDDHMSFFYDLKVEGHEDQRYAKTMNSFLGRMSKEQRTAWDSAYGSKNDAFLKSNLQGKELVRWKYQRYVKDYLRCVAAVDDGVGRILDALDKLGLSENSIVIYSSDQGFYLGEHGWYDKRWIYEESLKMPLVMRWPGKIKPGTKIKKLTQNIDFAPFFLDAAGSEIPDEIQGKSLIPLFKDPNSAWRNAIYYHYYEAGGHGVPAHYGIRDERYKLVHFPKSDEWNLVDLKKDPMEMQSFHESPKYQMTLASMQAKLTALQNKYGVKLAR
jgi:arylsulfatase A-like enzyme|tara:strand:- start:1736 stop:3265 length:1530 start_codon:yes stop_codon:yes gene_type:complete